MGNGPPGPMQFISAYTKRANGEEKVKYLTPEMEAITKDTFGILIYQESIMQLAQVLGGYTAGESDVLRKSVGKKKKDLLEKSLVELKDRIIKNGYSEKIADEACEQIRPFAGYGFNKSHAFSYAYVACQTAYFKAHYPLEFYTSLLTINATDEDKVKAYIKDAQEHGINFLPPDINQSKLEYIIEDNKIRVGLMSVKGIAESAINAIVTGQPYSNPAEYINKVAKEGSKKDVLQTLALSGAMDSLYQSIGSTLNRPQIMLDLWGKKKIKPSDESKEEAAHLLSHFDNRMKLTLEKKYFGYYASGNPLDGLAEPVDFQAIPQKKSFSARVIISGMREILTKKNDPMAFATFEFVNMEYPVVIFPRTYVEEFNFRKGKETIRSLVKDGMIVDATMHKQYNLQKGSMDIIVDSIKVPIKLNQGFID